MEPHLSTVDPLQTSPFIWSAFFEARQTWESIGPHHKQHAEQNHNRTNAGLSWLGVEKHHIAFQLQPKTHP